MTSGKSLDIKKIIHYLFCKAVLMISNHTRPVASEVSPESKKLGNFFECYRCILLMGLTATLTAFSKVQQSLSHPFLQHSKDGIIAKLPNEIFLGDFYLMLNSQNTAEWSWFTNSYTYEQLILNWYCYVTIVLLSYKIWTQKIRLHANL